LLSAKESDNLFITLEEDFNNVRICITVYETTLLDWSGKCELPSIGVENSECRIIFRFEEENAEAVVPYTDDSEK